MYVQLFFITRISIQGQTRRGLDMIFPGGRGRVTSRNVIVPSPSPARKLSLLSCRARALVFENSSSATAPCILSDAAGTLDSRPACCHCRRFRRRWWRRAASNRGTEIAPARADTERVPLQRYRGATRCNACPATQRDVRKVDVKEDLSLSCARAHAREGGSRSGRPRARAD